MSKRLAEVARKVGVSEATVSRVLNEKPGVSEATRQAVLTALDVLGYERPTKLRGERARLVGLVLPELQNPIFPAFAEVSAARWPSRATRRCCAPRPSAACPRRTTSSCCSSSRSRASSSPAACTPRPTRRTTTTAGSPSAACPPCWSTPRIDGLGFPRVSCDDAVAVEQAMGHLLSLGHTRIGLLLGPARPRPSRRKLERAPDARRERRARRSAPDDIAHSLYSLEAAQAAATRLLAPGVTGIVCASDPMALGAIRAVRRAGLSVPDDVSVVGFDDSALMNCTEPPLTTVRQPIEPMGRMVIELLVGQIAGTPVPHDELLFEPELVVRGSTGPAPDRADRRAPAIAISPRDCRDLDQHSFVKFLHSFVGYATLPPAAATLPLRADREPPDEDDVTEPASPTGRAPARSRRRAARPAAPSAGLGRPDRGGAAPSSTRSTSAASPTATATGPATSPASASRLPYLRDLGVDAIWFTPWYVSPLADGGYDVADYRAIDPAFGTLEEAEALIAEALDARDPDDHRRRPEPRLRPAPWFQAALAAGPGLARARALLVPPRARRRTATRRRPAGSPSSRASPWTRTTNPDGTPGEWYLHLFTAEQPDLNWDHPDVRAEHEDDPAVLVRPRRRRRPHRLGGAAGQGPGAARGPGRPGAGRAPAPTTATSSTTSTAAGARSPTRTRARASSSARSGCRTSSGSRGTCGRTSCTPPSTSTSWPGRGTRRSLRASIDATLAAHAPVGAPATWVLSNHDVTRPVTRYGRDGLVVRVRAQAVRRRRPTSTLGRRRARAAALLTAALPGSLYIYQGDELGLDEVEVPLDRDPGPDALPVRRHRPGPRRLPRAAALERRPRRPFGFSPAGRDRAAVADASRPTGRA